jgi:hypothetical protein
MRMQDGTVLTGATALDQVKQMRLASHTPERDTRIFMRRAAERVMMQFGKRVRTHPPEAFIADLVEIGLLIDEVQDDAKA